MRRTVAGAVALVLTWGAAAGQDTTKQPTAEDVAKAEKAVKEQLEKYKAAYGQVKQVKDETLAKTFPSYTFFAVLYRQFPVGRVVPKPLKPANVFAVSRDGKPELINDGKTLEKFFAAHLAPCTQKREFVAAARAWMVLAPELRQDGFFAFEVGRNVGTNLYKKGGGNATGKATVMRGGNGTLTAKLTFDDKGKLAKVEEKSTIRPGPRPICQATKLLDKDPIVRRMAEQDLLYLGRLARPYLDEQRAKAAPELRRAIDRLWQRILAEDQ